jgi:GAF domain-containing protein/DNA-binding CsgD family transcriptional regulator
MTSLEDDFGERPRGREGLEARVRQKEAVAGLGLRALAGDELAPLMDEAVEVVALVLCVDYAKVLELLPDGDRLLLRAGVGWKKGYVGRATVGTNLESQAGYTLISDGPIVVEDLGEEIRFKGAPLLHDHGVTSGVTVAIRLGERFFGVLGAHTREKRAFAGHEVLFLRDVADVLGAAVERKQEEEGKRLAAVEQSERAGAAERRFEFLAEANALLSASSLDYATTLRNAARLAVPTVADWCFVDVVEGGAGGSLRRASVGYSDPGGEELAEELKHRYPLDPGLAHGTPKVLRTGRSELIPEVDDGVLRSIVRDAGRLEVLRRLRPRSYMCVPLRVRGRLLGAMGFIETDRRYGEDDLALAEGLAHCVALAIDSAQSHLPEAAMAREIVRLAKGERGAAGVPVPDHDAPDLTRRQAEVLGLMADGMPAREIGRKLHLSEATVRNHIRAIKQAFGARSQLEAIAQARKTGVLPR